MLQLWKFSSLKLHSTSFWKLQSNISAVLELSETLGNVNWQSAPTAAAMLQSQWGWIPCSPVSDCMDHLWTGNSFVQRKLKFPTEIFYFEGFGFLPVNLYDREAAYQQTRGSLGEGYQGWSTCPTSSGWRRWASSVWRRDVFGKSNSSFLPLMKRLSSRWRQVLYSSAVGGQEV